MVEAKYHRTGQWCTGVVFEQKDDCTVDVSWDVPDDNPWEPISSVKMEIRHRDARCPLPLAVGDEAMALAEDGSWYPGIVKAELDNGAFQIAWDEPTDEELAVVTSHVRLVARGRVPRCQLLRPGDTCRARCPEDGVWYHGMVYAQEDDDMFIVAWDDPCGMEPFCRLQARDIKLKRRSW